MEIETIFCIVFFILISFIVGYLAMTSGTRGNYKGKDWSPGVGYFSMGAVGCVIVVIAMIIIMAIGWLMRIK